MEKDIEIKSRAILLNIDKYIIIFISMQMAYNLKRK